jgi:hypothetical protein
LTEDALDLEKVSYFTSRYQQRDVEELNELAGRRLDLADEAVAALDAVFADRTTTLPELKAESVGTAAMTVADATSASKALWNGSFAWICKTEGMAIGGVLGQAFTQRMGALWVGAAVFILGWIGYRVAKEATRIVCANGDSSLNAKRIHLVVLALGFFVALAVAVIVKDFFKAR